MSVLEVGCGGGAVAARLAEVYEYVGYEPDTESYALAMSRLSQVGRGEVINDVLPDAPTRMFDIVCAFEVLEHIEGDAAALEKWAAWARPGGRLVLSVPAHPDRFGPADEAVGHYRRYTREGLMLRLRSAGLVEVEILSVGFPLGHLLEFVRNRLARGSSGASIGDRTARSGRWFQPSGAFGIVAAVGTAPFRVLQRAFVHTDLGTGYVACARVPG